MLFEGLGEKLQNTFKKLRGKGKLTEKDINEAMREVKLALLEADVNFKVVKEFVNSVKERSLGADVLESLTPAQQVIKIVNEELVQLMGGTQSKLTYSPKGLTVLLMAGLQGTGKTTTCGKLALYLKKQNKNPMMAACDIYRPAAVDQLKIVGEKVGVPVFSKEGAKPEDIAKEALIKARNSGYDVLIVDTSGRLHIDDELMDELERIKESVDPHEILLVVDAMTGQDAVNVAEGFDKKLGVHGVIMTKLDGDTRGGAALSVKAVTGKPIKFIGVGEKLDALEPFYPDRMASRILGMGDMLSLIEKAQESFDEKKAKELESKMKNKSFNLEDFLEQLRQMKNMGSMKDILNMIPGLNNNKALKGMDLDDKELAHVEAIISSMTKKERLDPSIINGSRRKRIAAGSGMPVSKVNSVLKQFEQTKKLMKQFSGMGGMGKKGKMRLPFM
ncbi:MAG: signal recognition particle protein [Peptostreptococcales bacterium]